jgi:hypothetical protein
LKFIILYWDIGYEKQWFKQQKLSVRGQNRPFLGIKMNEYRFLLVSETQPSHMGRKKRRISRAEDAKGAEEEVLFPGGKERVGVCTYFLISAWLGGLCERKKRKRDSRAEGAGDAEGEVFPWREGEGARVGLAHSFFPLRNLAISARGKK